jgi:hypothetical protein
MHTTTDRGNRERWAAVAKATRKCQYCPPHGKENVGRRPRPDRHKDKRR